MIRARVWEGLNLIVSNTWEPDPRGNNIIIHVADCRKLLRAIAGKKSKQITEAVRLLKSLKP